MNANSYRVAQKRSRALRLIRESHTAMLWVWTRTDAAGKRLRTIHARNLAERSKELWRLLQS